MSCEIIDKETGDRVNVVAGIFAWVLVGAVVACAVGRACQEIKKHSESSKAPAIQLMTNSVQNVR